jgi:hypothetical protein
MKPLTAILAAAAAAAVITLLTAPSEPVTARPMPQATADAMHACANRPWPYLNCVGTQFGNPKVRLVTTDKLN